MAFTPNLSAAAYRHKLAADELEPGPRHDVAGYLYGISAECAIKAMMIQAGIKPLPKEQRRSDPFYAHFPELRTMLRDQICGRRMSTLRRFIENDSFMTQWNTDMRYCKGSEIDKRWVTSWKDQTHQIIAALGT